MMKSHPGFHLGNFLYALARNENAQHHRVDQHNGSRGKWSTLGTFGKRRLKATCVTLAAGSTCVTIYFVSHSYDGRQQARNSDLRNCF